MKKHGQRMMGLGMLALLLLAMASDAGHLGLVPLSLLAAFNVALILVGDMFTRPRRKHRRTARTAPAALHAAPLRPAFRPAA